MDSIDVLITNTKVFSFEHGIERGPGGLSHKRGRERCRFSLEAPFSEVRMVSWNKKDFDGDMRELSNLK